MMDVGQVSSSGALPTGFSHNLSALEDPNHYRMEFFWPADNESERNPNRKLRLTRSFNPVGTRYESLEHDDIDLNLHKYSEDISTPGRYTFTLRDPLAPNSIWDLKTFVFVVPQDCVMAKGEEINVTELSCGRLYLPDGDVRLSNSVKKITAFHIFANKGGSRLIKMVPDVIDPPLKPLLLVESQKAEGKLVVEVSLAPDGKAPDWYVGWKASIRVNIFHPEGLDFAFRFPESIQGKDGAAVAYLGDRMLLYPQFRAIHSDVRGLYRVKEAEDRKALSGSEWLLITGEGVLFGFTEIDAKLKQSGFWQTLLISDDFEVNGKSLVVKKFKVRSGDLKLNPQTGKQEFPSSVFSLELEQVGETESLPASLMAILKSENLYRAFESKIRAQRVVITNSFSGEWMLENLGPLERFYELLSELESPSYLTAKKLVREVIVDFGFHPNSTFGSLFTIVPNSEFQPERSIQYLNEENRKRLLQPD